MKAFEIGEKEMIWRILRKFPSNRNGDDAVPIELGDLYVLITVDGISEWEDWIPGARPFEMGWYSCAFSMSDIAACGGTPLSILASLTFSKEFEVEKVEEFLRGIEECASVFSAHLDGGDLNQGKGFVADVVSLGIVKKEEFLSRGGAKPGDLVFVTGDFGDQGAAIREILKGEKVPKDVWRKTVTPVPRIKEGRELARTGKVSSMVDSSDGLYESLLELSKASRVMIEVEMEKVPEGEWHSREFSGKIEDILFGGGELELVFTGKKDLMDLDLGFEITEIGKVRKGSGVKILMKGEEMAVKGHGWRHFS